MLVQELRKDRAVVLAAVQQNGGALKYAAEERLRGSVYCSSSTRRGPPIVISRVIRTLNWVIRILT